MPGADFNPNVSRGGATGIGKVVGRQLSKLAQSCKTFFSETLSFCRSKKGAHSLASSHQDRPGSGTTTSSTSAQPKSTPTSAPRDYGLGSSSGAVGLGFDVDSSIGSVESNEQLLQAFTDGLRENPVSLGKITEGDLGAAIEKGKSTPTTDAFIKFCEGPGRLGGSIALYQAISKENKEDIDYEAVFALIADTDKSQDLGTMGADKLQALSKLCQEGNLDAAGLKKALTAEDGGLIDLLKNNILDSLHQTFADFNLRVVDELMPELEIRAELSGVSYSDCADTKAIIDLQAKEKAILFRLCGDDEGKLDRFKEIEDTNLKNWSSVRGDLSDEDVAAKNEELLDQLHFYIAGAPRKERPDMA